MKRAIVFTVILICAPLCLATTIHVPADQPTIQSGINYAVTGDTVLVAPGSYSEQINFLGKGIVVRSSHGPAVTTLRSDFTPTVQFVLSEPCGAEFEGFTLRNMQGHAFILISNNAQPTVRNNIFMDLIGSTVISCSGSYPLIERNRFLFNDMGNGCIGVWNGAADITNNTFDGNSGAYFSHGNTRAKNNIISNSFQYGIYGSYSELSYNDVWNSTNGYLAGAAPGVGSISQNPLYLDPAGHDYCPSDWSPCIDAGDPDPKYNDPDGSRNDMGAIPVSFSFPVCRKINYGALYTSHLVATLVPEIHWSYYDTSSTQQVAFELQVGTDTDWVVSELWNSGVVTSADTEITYSGLPLVDDSTFYLRLRAYNGSRWGGWTEDYFHIHFVKAIHVPADQPTIQAGIDAAVDWDTVLVAPGAYSENLIVRNKSITLLSSDGASETMIVPHNPDTSSLQYLEVSHKVNTLQGFEFSGSRALTCVNSAGGYIQVTDNRFVANSTAEGALFLLGSCTVKDNWFEGNVATQHGGALRLGADGSSEYDGSIVEGNTFLHNYAYYGGGIDLLGAKGVTVRYNLFVFDSSQSYGAAVYLGGSKNIMVVNNTIDGCGSRNGFGGGICFWACSNDTAYNNIIVNCLGAGVWQMESEGCYVAFNDCYGNIPENYRGITPGAGSLVAYPQFMEGKPFNYHLCPTSPCIDAGNPDPKYNDPDGSRNDMGAIPFRVNHVPSAFALVSPNNSLDTAMTILRPTFAWTASIDPDGDDTVGYDLMIAVDSNFAFVQSVPNLSSTTYKLTTDLFWGHRYWWKVRSTDLFGGVNWSTQVFTFRTITLGDGNNDAVVTVADVVFLINYIFLGGGEPQPLMTGDPNCDGRINIADVVYLINYIFVGGPAPCTAGN